MHAAASSSRRPPRRRPQPWPSRAAQHQLGFSRAAFMFDTQPAANGTPNATNTPNRKRPGRSAARNDSGTGRYADDAEPAETNAASTDPAYVAPSRMGSRARNGWQAST